MLIGETDFAQEDIQILSHPNFEDNASVFFVKYCKKSH